jgi:hypothetical protein
MLASGAFNLIMAAVWLVLGVAVLVADPPQMRFSFGGTTFSTGWVALLFAAYNVVRWWSLRSRELRRRAAEELERRRPGGRPPGRPEPERNPDFIFEDTPPDKSA